ncbi:MAG: hypothetical protein DSZ24_01370 [Thermodesulfatator sp.]|nr:MAG: hypothetical protein DSZ24_01370 [Thermodesulfatator sp.]
MGGGMRRLCVPLFVFLLSSPLWGASYYSLALHEWQVVKGASLLQESFWEAPFPTTVVTSEEIRRFGWYNLRDLLEFQPSFYLIQDVNERVVGHRGLYRTITSHLLFREEGFDLYLPGYHAFPADASYPVYGLSRVEIMRGPGASLYGDAALTGVINLERQPLEKGAFLGRVGDYDRESLSAFLQEGSPSWGHFFLEIHYADLEGEEYHEDHGYQLLHSRPHNYALEFRYEKGPLKLFYTRLYSYYATPRAQSGRLLFPQDREPYGSREVISQDLLGLSLEGKWKGWQWVVRPYWSKYKIDTPQVQHTHAEGHFTALDIDLEGFGWGLETLARYPHQRGEFLLGGRFQTADYEKTEIETYSAGLYSRLSYPWSQEEEWSLFAQEKFYFRKNLILQLGARYDSYESFGEEVSPRLALIWRLRPSWALALSWASAFQAPNYLYRQKNRSGYGSRCHLDAEKIYVFNFSLTHFFKKNFWARLTLFHQNLQDIITYHPRERLYTNSGEAEIMGSELELHYFTRPFLWFLNYTYLRPTQSNGWVLASGERILNWPKWMVKGGLSWQWRPGLYLSPLFRFYGRVKTLQGWLSPYAIWDLNLLWEGTRWGLALKIENLFDHHYKRGGTVPPYPWPGRTFWLNLEVKF